MWRAWTWVGLALCVGCDNRLEVQQPDLDMEHSEDTSVADTSDPVDVSPPEDLPAPVDMPADPPDMPAPDIPEEMMPPVDMPPVCEPTTCAQQGQVCGTLPDGCGAQLMCGTCPNGQRCEGGQCVAAPVDCSGIANTPGYELCSSSASECAGVFTQGGNCDDFCAAAGLSCKAHYGGEPGCIGPELGNMFACGTRTGNQSDWCVCGSDNPPPNPACPGQGRMRSRDHSHPSVQYTNRSAWVLQCRPTYAYTAQFDEHEACDSLYRRGSGRGSAIFTFNNVAPGLYDVFVTGRHTNNRNRAGALFHVDFGGQRVSKNIMQREDRQDEPLQRVLHGTYCLSGTVVVTLDSTVSPESDSVSNVSLVPK